MKIHKKLRENLLKLLDLWEVDKESGLKLNRENRVETFEMRLLRKKIERKIAKAQRLKMSRLNFLYCTAVSEMYNEILELRRKYRTLKKQYEERVFKNNQNIKKEK